MAGGVDGLVAPGGIERRCPFSPPGASSSRECSWGLRMRTERLASRGGDAIPGLGEAAPEGQFGAGHPRNRGNTHVEILFRLLGHL
jgi:hypothetical protein